MYLTFVEKGTPMTAVLDRSSAAGAAQYEIVFHEMSSDTSFFARGEELYKDFSGMGFGDRLRVTFARGANVYTFSARAKSASIENGEHLTLIEQLTGMEAISRRSDHRDEITLTVRLYGLNQSDLEAGRRVKADVHPVFTGETFDISNGGICLVSDDPLESKFEPYFLLEFVLAREKFLLPAKLLRKGKCPQTTIYRYDYGFEFVYDGIERERTRLTNALFNQKYESFNR